MHEHISVTIIIWWMRTNFIHSISKWMDLISPFFNIFDCMQMSHTFCICKLFDSHISLSYVNENIRSQSSVYRIEDVDSFYISTRGVLISLFINPVPPIRNFWVYQWLITMCAGSCFFTLRATKTKASPTTSPYI